MKLFPSYSLYKAPSDQAECKGCPLHPWTVVRFGSSLSPEVYIPESGETGVRRSRSPPWQESVAAQPVASKMKEAMRAGTIKKGRIAARVEEALSAGVINDDEVAILEAAKTSTVGGVQ